MGDVLVDYSKNLSLLNTAERIYYTNNNDALPKDVNKLEHIAGYGNSKLIKYNGRGTYFLDKLNDDLWKLEIFPDAVWLKDPFGKNGLDNPVAKLIWKSHKMKIKLPVLNRDFKVYSPDNKSQAASDNTVTLKPGVYLIANKEKTSKTKSLAGVIDFDKIKKYGDFINDFESIEIKNLTPASFCENEEKKITIEDHSGKFVILSE